MPPAHKVTEAMPRLGRDCPFNPFCWGRAGKKCQQRFPQPVLVGKGGRKKMTREENIEAGGDVQQSLSPAAWSLPSADQKLKHGY